MSVRGSLGHVLGKLTHLQIASLAIASGVHVKVLQQMLGHSSAAMTMDVNGHLFGDRLDESPRRSTTPAPRPPDPPLVLPMLRILLPKGCQTPMWSTWLPTGRKVKPQVRRQIRMAPPARFELALPPPEGGTGLIGGY